MHAPKRHERPVGFLRAGLQHQAEAVGVACQPIEKIDAAAPDAWALPVAGDSRWK